MTNKHDEIKNLLKASKSMLSNNNTLLEHNDIRKQYNLLTEQGVVPTSGNRTKKIDVATAIEDEIDSDDEEMKKSAKDKKQGYRISGGVIVFHGKKQSELDLTTDEKVAFQETMNEFVAEVSDLVEFDQLNVYPNAVEWSGKILEFNIDFIYLVGKENNIYIQGDMINADDKFLDFIQKLKSYYEKFKSKWSKILGNRKLTKLS